MGNVLEKLRGLDAPKVLALVDALGGREIVDEILGGKKFVTIDDVVRPLFNDLGYRRISNSLNSKACKADSAWRFYKPKMVDIKDYNERLAQLNHCLQIDTGLTAEEFKKQADYLLDLIQSDHLVSNISKGVCLPIVLPRLTENLDNTFNRYLAGIRRYHSRADVYFDFYNHYERSNNKGVRIYDASGQHGLIKKMKKRSVVALFFPSCLQGFSVLASREQKKSLPSGFALSAIETLIAIMMYPEILVSIMRLPGLSLSGFSSEVGCATLTSSIKQKIQN